LYSHKSFTFTKKLSSLIGCFFAHAQIMQSFVHGLLFLSCLKNSKEIVNKHRIWWISCIRKACGKGFPKSGEMWRMRSHFLCSNNHWLQRKWAKKMAQRENKMASLLLSSSWPVVVVVVVVSGEVPHPLMLRWMTMGKCKKSRLTIFIQ